MVDTNGEVGSIAGLTDDEDALAFGIELIGLGEVVFRGATLDAELTIH